MNESMLVAGVGDGLGKSVARRFAKEGFRVAVLARSAERLARITNEIRTAGGEAQAYICDVAKEAEVIRTVAAVESDLGPLGAAVFNVSGRARGSILELEAADFENSWRMGCFAGFLVGREAARTMVPRGRGTLIFTGATASLRGGSHFAGFAAAKSGLRMVAQSMARELGPKGIHVASVIVDGAIDSARMHEQSPERIAALGPDGALHPDAIADTYWHIHTQPRSAWSFETDIRPWAEKF